MNVNADHQVNMPSVDTNLNMLSELRPGWDGEEAVEIDRSALEMVKLILQSLQDSHLPIPYCAPVPDGRIDVEWSDLGIICTFDCEDVSFHQANESSFTCCYQDKNLWNTFADAFVLAIRTKTSNVSQLIAPAMFPQ